MRAPGLDQREAVWLEKDYVMRCACPSCHRQLSIPENAVGKLVQCPVCRATFQGPAPAAEPIETAEAAARPPSPGAPPFAEEDWVSPRPRPRANEDEARPWRRYDDEDEEPPPRFRGRDYDEDDEEVRRRGKAAGLWFLIAAIATIGLVTFNIASYLIARQEVGLNAGPGNAAEKMGQTVGLLGCGVMVAVGAVFMFLANASLRSFKGKGMVITAIVFGFLFAVAFGLGVLINLAVVVGEAGRRLPEVVRAMSYGTIILGSATTFLNLFAAIKAIVTLSNPAVARAFR